MAAIGTSFANYNENKKLSDSHQRRPVHKAEHDFTNTRLADNNTLSPNKVKVAVKTTKSVANPNIST